MQKSLNWQHVVYRSYPEKRLEIKQGLFLKHWLIGLSIRAYSYP